jgi:hypothetical protein
LDVLRAGKSFPAFLVELKKSIGKDAVFDLFYTHLEKCVNTALNTDLMSAGAQRGARGLVDKLAVGLQAALLLEHGLAASAQGYLESRVRPLLGFDGSRSCGTDGMMAFSANYGSFPYDEGISKTIIDDSFLPIEKYL